MRGSGGGDAWTPKGVSPPLLVLAGLLLAPALILQRRLDVKALQLMLLYALVRTVDPEGAFRSAAGTLVFLAMTVVLNLASPAGRILARIGALVVTGEALRAGLDKALGLAALMYLSRFFLRGPLKLPGSLGRYLGDTIQYFHMLLEYRPRARLRNLAHDLDQMFEAVCRRPLKRRPEAAGRNTASGLVMLASLVALNYLWLFSR